MVYDELSKSLRKGPERFEEGVTDLFRKSEELKKRNIFTQRWEERIAIIQTEMEVGSKKRIPSNFRNQIKPTANTSK